MTTTIRTVHSAKTVNVKMSWLQATLCQMRATRLGLHADIYVPPAGTVGDILEGEVTFTVTLTDALEGEVFAL